MRPKIAIIWVCWKNLRHLPEVVASWEQLTYSKDRLTIVIVPAQSPDGIADVVRREVLPRSGKDLPEVVLLDQENKGFAGNYNYGMRWATAQGCDYVYLQNGDLKLGPDAITEAVMMAETDTTIGAVQSLVCYWHEPEKVNVTGGSIHVAGYGYARDNGRLLAEVTVQNGEALAYASCAAVLYPAPVLQKVGLLEEGFFMYHEDLEMGMRLTVAGYRNVLATRSLVYHDYQFGRTEKMFEWIETNRWIVLFGYLKPATIALLTPFWLALELGSWLMMLKSGTVGAKIATYKTFLTARPWKLIGAMRYRTQQLRVVSDRTLTRLWTGKIEAQAVASPLMDRVINPVVDGIWRQLRKCIVW